MKHKTTYFSAFTFILFLCFINSGFTQLKKNAADTGSNLHFHVEEAPEWTALFISDTSWIGGDGLFSFALDGVDTTASFHQTQNLLVFSDSFWGKRKNGQVRPGGTMVNNSMASLQKIGHKPAIRFFNGNGSAAEKVKSVFVPNIPLATAGSYYWLGDGFINQEQHNKLYIFAYLMRNTGAKVFGFQEFGNALIKVDPKAKSAFKQNKQIQTPLFVDSTANSEAFSFGAGVFVNTQWAGAPHPDGYVYIYGVRGKEKELLVARVKPKDIEDFGRWSYWNGQQWQSDIHAIQPLTKNVSNEMSVTALADGRYLLIFQKNGIEPTIGMRIGSSPTGPFGPIVSLYECPEPKQKKSLFAYNAKAHPNLSEKGELLISYHVNSFDFLKDFKEDPDMFAPKFIRLVFD